MFATELKYHIKVHGRQKSAEMLDYRPELLDKLAKRGAVVINGQVFAPVTKRTTRKVASWSSA